MLLFLLLHSYDADIMHVSYSWREPVVPIRSTKTKEK